MIYTTTKLYFLGVSYEKKTNLWTYFILEKQDVLIYVEIGDVLKGWKIQNPEHTKNRS